MIHDEDLDGYFKAVGKPLSVYRAPVWRIWVGIVVMFLFGIGTILGFLFAERRPGDPDHLVLMIGIGSMSISAGILFHHLRSRHRRIFVCVEGLALDEPPMLRSYRWGDIVRIQEEKDVDQIHLIPVGTYRAATIEFVDGHRLFLNRNRIGKVGQLIDIIQTSVWACRSQAATSRMDGDLARVVATWPTLTRDDRYRILSIVERAKPASDS